MKVMLKMMVAVLGFLYKVSGGKIAGTIQGLPVLLLTTTGRKTGKQRTVPLGFLDDGENYVVIASYAGQPQNPAWYHNLKSGGAASIQVGRKIMQVKAEVAGPEKKQELWARLVAIAPGYDNYQKQTTRDIPVVILHPIT